MTAANKIMTGLYAVLVRLIINRVILSLVYLGVMWLQETVWSRRIEYNSDTIVAKDESSVKIAQFL